LLAQEAMRVKAFERAVYLSRLHAHDVEDAKLKPHCLKLPYKIPIEYQSPSSRQIGDADDVTFNLTTDNVPVSSIADKSND
jgi:hypothetical protein